MNTAKAAIMAMIVAFAMIGTLGFAAAMNTNVVYSGDGSYVCNYDAHGTGYIGIHTYTSDGSDHLMSSWTNSEANGWQEMNTYSATAYSGTVIDRVATVGDAGVGEDEAGYIITITTDNDANRIYTHAIYHDDRGWGSHVTTDQTIVVGSLVNIGNTPYTVTGVAAVTDIKGFAYGDDTMVSGLVRTQSGDEYAYAYLRMYNGKMILWTLSATGSVDPAVTVPPWFSSIPIVGFNLISGEDIDGACGQIVVVDARGIGTFGAGAGTDMHGAAFWMYEDANYTYYDSSGTDETMAMTTTFDGKFDANGYVYAVDLP